MRTALMVVVVAFGATQAAWTQPPTPAAGATIEVRVAADAAVTFDGYATQSRGPTRTFIE